MIFSTTKCALLEINYISKSLYMCKTKFTSSFCYCRIVQNNKTIWSHQPVNNHQTMEGWLVPVVPKVTIVVVQIKSVKLGLALLLLSLLPSSSSSSKFCILVDAWDCAILTVKLPVPDCWPPHGSYHVWYKRGAHLDGRSHTQLLDQQKQRHHASEWTLPKKDCITDSTSQGNTVYYANDAIFISPMHPPIMYMLE